MVGTSTETQFETAKNSFASGEIGEWGTELGVLM